MMDDNALQQMFEYGIATPLHCRDREETGVIRPGAHARVVGLSSRTDLNGCHGVVGSFDIAKLRWAVHMMDTGEGVRVKPSNIRVDAKQPASVPSASQWLSENVPSGMKFQPKMPPIPMPGMPPPPTAEQQAVQMRKAAEAMAMLTIEQAQLKEQVAKQERARSDTRGYQDERQDALLRNLQREDANCQASMDKDWPVGVGDDGPWHEACGLPRGYVKRDGSLFYVGGIPRSLAEEWGVGAGDLGYEGEPHTAESKEEAEAALNQIMMSMGVQRLPNGMWP